MQPRRARGEELAALRVGVVGDDEATAVERLEQLLGLAAGRGAHVEHVMPRPNVEQQRRHHRDRLLPLNPPELGLAQEPRVQRLDGGRAAGGARRVGVGPVLAAERRARDARLPC